MTVGIEISDSRIAAGKPVTSRLMRAYRDNINILTQVHARATGSGFLGGTSSDSWDTLFTFALFVPDTVIGSGGTRLVLDGAWTSMFAPLAQPAQPPTTYYIRLVIDGNYGITYTSDAVGYVSGVQFEITWTPSANTTVDVELAGAVVNTYNSVGVTFNNSGGGYLTMGAVE